MRISYIAGLGSALSGINIGANVRATSTDLTQSSSINAQDFKAVIARDDGNEPVDRLAPSVRSRPAASYAGIYIQTGATQSTRKCLG